MRYRIVQHPDLDGDLRQIRAMLRRLAGPRSAHRHLVLIRDSIRRLADVPHIGTLRDVVPELRVIPAGEGAVVAFLVDDFAREVMILSVTWGGADWMGRVRRRI